MVKLKGDVAKGRQDTNNTIGVGDLWGWGHKLRCGAVWDAGWMETETHTCGAVRPKGSGGMEVSISSAVLPIS